MKVFCPLINFTSVCGILREDKPKSNIAILKNEYYDQIVRYVFSISTQYAMNNSLDNHQKHKLHLLLRASLKNSNVVEAIEKIALDPALFADIFLRNDKNREVSYEELEKLSYLCCLVIDWRDRQLPQVDCNRTYLGQVDLLLDELSKNGLTPCES